MSILYGYVLSIDFRRKEYPTMHTSISGSFSRSSSFFGGSKKSKRQSQSFSVHRSMNETGYLMRLASARTPSQVSAVIAGDFKVRETAKRKTVGKRSPDRTRRKELKTCEKHCCQACQKKARAKGPGAGRHCKQHSSLRSPQTPCR